MHHPLVSRRTFIQSSLAIGVGIAAPALYRTFARPISECDRDVCALQQMIDEGMFGDVTHCVGDYEDFQSIMKFLGSARGNRVKSVQCTYSSGVSAMFIQTTSGATATIYKDQSATRAFAGMLRVQGSRGICMLDQNKIYLHGISPAADAWEDFTKYRERFGAGA